MRHNFRIPNTASALLSVLAFAAVSGTATAGAITVDGVRDGNDDYTNSFIANWTNEHHKHGSVFDDGTDETTVWWEEDAGSYFLFIEAPLVAKNMIWGAGVSAAELLLYDVHNTHIESNGTPHHDPLTGITHHMATDSEKAIFAGITAKLKDDTVMGAGGILEDNATSHSYLHLLPNSTCDEVDCFASTTTMSFEFEFNLDSDEFQNLIDDIALNGIEFHLSPERGGPASTSVPEPTMLALMILGLFGIGFNRRKRFQ